MAQHTHLTVDDISQLHNMKIDPESKDIKEFWYLIEKNWLYLYNSLINYTDNAIIMINNYLPKSMNKYIVIGVTVGEVNNQELLSSKELIELYISPKYKIDNIPVMKALYIARINIKNLNISCYGAYHPMNIPIENINYNDLVVNYNDFGIQTQIVYKQLDNGLKSPILNILICIRKSIAYKILKEEKIIFNNNSKETSRNVFLPDVKYNAISILLSNIIGEYNMLNHIGYIEYIPEDKSQTIESDSFVELSNIRNELKIVHSNNNYLYCNYCGRNELQSKIFRCVKCKKIHYCGKFCQLADYTSHKNIC